MAYHFTPNRVGKVIAFNTLEDGTRQAIVRCAHYNGRAVVYPLGELEAV